MKIKKIVVITLLLCLSSTNGFNARTFPYEFEAFQEEEIVVRFRHYVLDNPATTLAIGAAVQDWNAKLPNTTLNISVEDGRIPHILIKKPENTYQKQACKLIYDPVSLEWVQDLSVPAVTAFTEHYNYYDNPPRLVPASVSQMNWNYADIVLCPSFDFSESNHFTLQERKQGTIAHEIGHALGLNHPFAEGDATNLMFKYGDQREVYQVDEVSRMELINKYNLLP